VISRANVQRLDISSAPGHCILSSIFATILTCEKSKTWLIFCEELSTVPSGECSRTRIIHAVSAVEDAESGSNSGKTTSLRLRRICERSLLTGVILLGIVYAADYAAFRYRLVAKTKDQAFGSVTVEHYDAVLHKDGKSELIFDPAVQQTCVHSIFPHAGYSPCWYLIRHSEQRTDI
jgi:hypothetical protein